ncbi:hypothetical protein NE237_020562 [Protea cynaroides]|uniref:C2 NT-type domain-containing protein n=1 Tax=Protea cynaroides TaxID=273540 RepID=A0A9Q0H6B8_9MAGN|nr:hypothetical protein NE237_020562 [Protea cynaroides]
METEQSVRRNCITQLLEELEALSQSLYQPRTSKGTASLALPQTSVPPISSTDATVITKIEDDKLDPRPRSRCMSLSPWRSRPKLDNEDQQDRATLQLDRPQQLKKFIDDNLASTGKKVTVQGLPTSMNGLRFSVCVRKKETRDGAVQTMPARILQGAADVEETLFVECHLYGSSSGGGKQFKFEPRSFWIYVIAVDADEFDFGRSFVDLSLLIQDSMEKSFEGMPNPNVGVLTIFKINEIKTNIQINKRLTKYKMQRNIQEEMCRSSH